ncbi:hypothetical protein HYH03_014742 [Edaphochlamys debaryana]|uniref:Uncharacterized protein n=1 Tax=Edaphochlamys debaryana TaxID=47281 RepID=A0A835XKQ4_9CHLO|nr:hypothetical protein HYH03_014742 [Edaphochlamys debaryana]|eukprot:KAG2486572.1 hypothetical protein HYH03_014742 [Edaphochlamys debaryana]
METTLQRSFDRTGLLHSPDSGLPACASLPGSCGGTPRAGLAAWRAAAASASFTEGHTGAATWQAAAPTNPRSRRHGVMLSAALAAAAAGRTPSSSRGSLDSAASAYTAPTAHASWVASAKPRPGAGRLSLDLAARQELGATPAWCVSAARDREAALARLRRDRWAEEDASIPE